MKFNLRDLLWLTAVVALALGWWVDHRWWKAEVRLLIERCEQVEANAVRNALTMLETQEELQRLKAAK